MTEQTSDVRIINAQPLITPWVLAQELPMGEHRAAFVASARRRIEAALAGVDGRMVCIVGPCSVHDPQALLEFAERFKAATDPLCDALIPVLRVYFEKPRTRVGWKGLINDPYLDNSFKLNDGLRIARELLLSLNDSGLPTAGEYLDMIIAAKVVGDVDEAIAHIRQRGSNHTDCIITEDDNTADRFFERLDSAILMRNASTQFADGAEFGMGAEIGIATGKMHARGPVGATQLTSFKYLVTGDGTVRS